MARGSIIDKLSIVATANVPTMIISATNERRYVFEFQFTANFRRNEATEFDDSFLSGTNYSRRRG